MKRHNKQPGFTIIEVLLVLAIAGLVLLIVFLAVPAMQRNSRNHGRAVDAAALLNGMREQHSATGSMFSTLPNQSTNFQKTCNPGNLAIFCPFVSNAKLGYYGVKDVQVIYNQSGSGALSGAAYTNNDTESVTIINGYKCAPDQSSSIPVSTTIGHAANLVAAITVETGGGTQERCIEL